MKVLGWIGATVTLIVAAVYMMASLYRWEWNRTLFFGLIVVIAEIALATALILNRLSRLAVRDMADPELLVEEGVMGAAAMEEAAGAAPTAAEGLEQTPAESEAGSA